MKVFLLTITLLLSISVIRSQTPQAISYQAVARDLNGNVLSEQDVSLQISIISGSVDGAVEYIETHDVSTNQFGLINIQIGKGTASQGDFSTINWGSSLFFSKIEIDINDGNGYQEIGISQMLAVPYALYAAKAYDTDFNFIITGIKDIECNIGESMTLPINLHWISGDQQNVALSVSGVPDGVNVTFETTEGNPDFATNINIEATESAAAGFYSISVIATADNGRTRTYTFDLEVIAILSAEFTVKDATSWTPENPSMSPAANATIKLYASQSSFDSNTPEYIIITDAVGFVKAYNITPGDYFLVVEKDNLSNVVNGYLIAGVYQTQAEVDSGPQQAGATVGGLKYTDVNGDGIVDSDDRVYHDNITISTDQTIDKTITIGEYTSSITLIQTEQEVGDALTVCQNNMNDFASMEYIFDGVFTGTASAPSTSWDNISAKYLYSTDSNIALLWNNAYEIIDQANVIISSVKAIDMDESNRILLIAMAKSIRAYIYYHLVNLYGDVPLLIEPVDPLEPVSQNTVEEVYALIEDDLQTAQSVLSYTSESQISDYFTMGLLARVYIQQEEWTEAANITDQIINSAQFSLVASVADAFISVSSETILGFEKGDFSDFNTFFTKGNYVPFIRYTEVLLLRAESLFRLGNISEAEVIINQLKERRSETPLADPLSTEELLSNWETELAIEGTWFLTLKRFGQAIDKLQIQQYNLLLPIPFSAMISNPYLTQNPGY